MLPIQFLLWLIVFPLSVTAFFVATTIRVFIFLFNCPVDIWIMIGESLREPKIKEQKTKNQ